MVELEFKGMCKGCKHAALELEELEWFTIDDGMEKIWKAKCIHEHVCRDWDEKLSEEKVNSV